MSRIFHPSQNVKIWNVLSSCNWFIGLNRFHWGLRSVCVGLGRCSYRTWSGFIQEHMSFWPMLNFAYNSPLQTQKRVLYVLSGFAFLWLVSRRFWLPPKICPSSPKTIPKLPPSLPNLSQTLIKMTFKHVPEIFQKPSQRFPKTSKNLGCRLQAWYGTRMKRMNHPNIIILVSKKTRVIKNSLVFFWFRYVCYSIFVPWFFILVVLSSMRFPWDADWSPGTPRL